MRRIPVEASRIPFLALAALHLAGCLYYFPPREIFSGEPLLTSDYVLHFLEAVRAQGYLRHGSFLGYSTTWMAGFPDGFAGMIKNKPFILAVAAVPPSWQPLVFNLTVLLSLWVFPLFVYTAARELGHDRGLGTISMGLAMVAWYGSGMFRVFWRGGSVIFIVGCGVALWTTARLWRLWTAADSGRSLWSVALGVAAVLWIHPAASVLILFGGAIAYGFSFRQHGLRARSIFVMGAVPAALNLPWLLCYHRHAHLLGSLYYAIYQGSLAHLLFDFVGGPLMLASGTREEVAVLGPLSVLALTSGALARDRRSAQRFLGSLAVLLGALAYFGHAVQAIGTLQPYRYAIPLAAVLAIGAAPGLLAITRRPLSKPRAALALVLLLLLANRVRSATVHSSDYLGAGLGKQEEWALDALRAALPADRTTRGRILLEGDWLTEPVTERPLALRVSYSFVGFERYLDGELIGAPATGIGLREAYASFWKGRLFGRDFADYDRDSFLRACDLYDISWVVTAHTATKTKLEEFAPSVALVDANGPMGVFRVDRAANRVLGGAGHAIGEGGAIRFESTVAGPAILKYHWIPGLGARPPAEVAPAGVNLDSPSPFVEIRPLSPATYVIDWPHGE